ncbi:ribosome small subunit-dependent GTPase A [Paenactinomyces guangxiensis]|uniref:Small ribosomal subunit biogenesis GTPase RsgA n=1 Tax=Paenactinomyces guangxiensis TaxID=1490290 RepID=A0A7W2A7P2_9BACL|nr:ribosome small subunit-dependent GTPase A [Paenactinomyces guangxiensis]MBA4494761.1 ribosome small subunit-dependent GTPase A [Paenactinomyces guangxiensis]MBH8591845.1 ribosome small subunit-dependent GTPase A [Paenactinomyces guangxiensis]
MPAGQIVKAISGFYYVRTPEGEEIQCRARGVFKFKKKKLTPLVGDNVEFEMTGLGEGVVTSVQPRQTELLRPPIANVEQAVVVCSLREPDFQQMPVDRFLVHGEREGLTIVICLTKRDLVSDDREVEQIRAIYEPAGYPVLATSIHTQVGLDQLKEHLNGRVSVLAGQSGVGKSSLLNRLLPGYQLQTGTVSQKLGRGRHTTRQVELLPLPSGGQVADTPGFSQLSFQGFEPGELSDYFPEFAEHAACCRFRGCLHGNEPGCEVREAVERQEIHQERYHNYLQFLDEIKQQQRRY